MMHALAGPIQLLAETMAVYLGVADDSMLDCGGPTDATGTQMEATRLLQRQERGWVTVC